MKAIVESSTHRLVVWSQPFAVAVRSILLRFRAGCVVGQDGHSCPCHLDARMLRAVMLQLSVRTADLTQTRCRRSNIAVGLPDETRGALMGQNTDDDGATLREAGTMCCCATDQTKVLQDTAMSCNEFVSLQRATEL